MDMATNPHNVNKIWRELKSAADSRNWTCVDDLLSASDVTRCDIEQSCLLHRLATAPEVSLSLARDILTKFVTHGVNINMVNNNKDTAIVLAARCDNTKMVMELLSRQAALPPDVTHVCSFLQTLTNNWKPQETPYMHALVVKLLWDRLKDTALHRCHTQLHHTLVRLAVTFHTSLVRHMFVTQQQVNAVDSEGMAVLHRVAMFDTDDHVRLVLFLIIKGADVNLQSTTGDTPLHVAVKHNNWKMMEALLHRRANSDVIDCEQRSVLHIAVSYTDPEYFSKLNHLLPLLIRNSNDINKRDREGNTALHLAALAGNIWFIKTLLDHGARADGVNSEHKTVLHVIAINEEYREFRDISSYTFLIIKKGADVDKKDSDGNLAIHLAARHENWDLVKALLKYSNIDLSDSEGFNVLHRFAMGSHSSNYDLFYELTQKVSDINARCPTGDAAIHLAAKHSNWYIVKLLITEGAIFDELDSEGFHIFHRRAMEENWRDLWHRSDSVERYRDDSGYLENFLLFIFRNKSISYNIPTLAGDVALHLAARHNNWFMVKLLAEAGENIDEKDAEGLTVIQRLVMSTTTNDSKQYSLFCWLLEIGVDETCHDQNGDSLLHLAARKGHWKIVEFLVKRGAKTEIPDSQDFLILHKTVSVTVDVNETNVPHLLLNNNHILEKRTKHGDTAVHLAAQCEQWKTVITLIEHGANVFDCDSEKLSVLQRMIQSPCTVRQSKSIIHKSLTSTIQKNTYRTLETLLYDAAKCGRWDVASHLMNLGVSIRPGDLQGFSLLHILAKDEKPCYPYKESRISVLMKEDGTISEIFIEKEPFQTVYQIVCELIQLFLSKEIGLEDRCPDGNTALQLAAKFDNWDLVRCLAEQGANCEGPDSEGSFVLQRLAMYKDFHKDMIELLQLLIQKGADAKICCPKGDSLLHLGSRANNWFFVYSIIRDTDDLDLDKLDNDGFNVMHRLAQSDNGSEWLEDFLKKPFNLSILSRNGDTCLLLAAKQDNWIFVQRFLEIILRTKPPSPCEVFHDLMLKHYLLKDLANKMAFLGLLQSKDSYVTEKINLDQRDVCGYTVWHLAVKRKVLLVGHLAECGADTDLVDDEGLGVLHSLASASNVDFQQDDYLLKLISKKRLLIKEKDGLGNTSIQVAAKNRNLTVFVLFHCYVHICTKDSDGLSLLHRIVQIIPNYDVSALENIIKYILMSGANINEMSEDNETPLHLAAKLNNWPVIRLLLKHGAQANVCDSEGQSVLHRLASRDFWEVPESQLQLIQELLDAGADIQQKDFQGNTPLHLAVQYQNWNVAQELVQLGAEVNKLDSEGYTVLHRMAQIMSRNQECQPLTQLLLDRGAGISSNRGETIIDIVTENYNWNMMKCLLTQGIIAIGEHNKESLWHILASCNFEDVYTDVCELLIKNGWSVNAVGRDGITPLHLAAEKRNWFLAVHLIKNGASGRMVNGNGLTILHRYFSEEQTINSYILKNILSSGVDVNAADPRGNTALHMAAKHELVDIMDCLLDNVQNINIEDREGFTVLLRLSQTHHRKCLPVCQRLVEAGADINTCSSCGVSALELAIRSDNWAVVDFLLRSGAQFDVKVMDQFHVLHHLIKCPTSAIPLDNLLNVVTLLANSGVSLNKPDSIRQTPAVLALKHEKWDVLLCLLEQIVHLNNSRQPKNSDFLEPAKTSSDSEKAARFLITSGLDINLKNIYGDIPIHLAADKDKWDIVKIFVEHGADTNTPDRKGYCLLHKLASCTLLGADHESNFALLNTLVRYKADINWRGPDNKTVFQTAFDKRNWEMVGWLIELGASYELSQKEVCLALNYFHCFFWKEVKENKIHNFINYLMNHNDTKTPVYIQFLQTIFERCLHWSNWKMAKAVAKCGADVTYAHAGQPLLQFMMSSYSQTSHAEWASFLDLAISRGLDINAKLHNRSGLFFCTTVSEGVLFHEETLKSLKCEEQSTHCLFNALLEGGADPLRVDSTGMTLLRKVVDFDEDLILNALKKLLPTGVTTHQPRFTEANRGLPQYIASPTEKVIQERNVRALKMLIESGASSNAELFRLNREYQKKFAMRAVEVLDLLEVAAIQVRSLKSLCRLAVSHCLGCGPARQDRIQHLPIPLPLQKLIAFCDITVPES